MRYAVERGTYGVHGVVAQRRRRRRALRLGRLLRDGVIQALTVARDIAGSEQRQRARLLRRRHAARRRARGARRARRAPGRERDVPHHACSISPTPGDIGVFVDETSVQAARGDDRPGRREGRPRARHRVQRAAAERPRLAVRGEQLPQREGRRRRSTCSTGTPTAPTCPGRCTAGTCATPTSRTGCACRASSRLRRARRSRQGAAADLHPRDARGPHRAVEDRRIARPSCCAGETGSCSARAGTSPASSTRRRRTGAATGRTTHSPAIPDEWLAQAAETAGQLVADWDRWLARFAGGDARPASAGSSKRRAKTRPDVFKPHRGRRASPCRSIYGHRSGICKGRPDPKPSRHGVEGALTHKESR